MNYELLLQQQTTFLKYISYKILSFLKNKFKIFHFLFFTSNSFNVQYSVGINSLIAITIESTVNSVNVAMKSSFLKFNSFSTCFKYSSHNSSPKIFFNI